MEKRKVYELMLKNAKTLAAKANGEVNQKIRMLQNICKNTNNYEVIEYTVTRIARLRALKAEVKTYTPETIADLWRISNLISVVREIDEF